MKIIPENSQDQGKRQEQQDAFGFSDFLNQAFVKKMGSLAVLADGMGGMECGKEAAQLAVEKILQGFMKQPVAVENKIAQELIPELLQAAHESIGCLAADAGTTLVLTLITNDKLYWYSVGDSRIYWWHDSQLKLLTIDDNLGSWLDQQVEQGKIETEQAKNHTQRSALTAYLGMRSPFIFQQGQILLEPGDKVILCSDGLHGVLSEDEIASVLKQCSKSYSEDLVKAVLAKNHPYQDNVTVLVLHCEKESIVNHQAKYFWQRLFKKEVE